MSATTGLAIVSRLALRVPEAVGQLERALEGNLPRLVDPALNVARSVGHPAAEALRRVAARQADAVLDDLIWAATEMDMQSNAIAGLRVEAGLRKLQRATESAEDPYDIQVLRSNCTVTLLLMGRKSEALPLVQANVEGLRDLRNGPRGADATDLYVSALLRLARIYEATKGKWIEARGILMEATSIARSLCKEEGATEKSRLALYICLSTLGQRLDRENDPEAGRILAETLEMHRRMRASDKPRRDAGAGPLLAYSRWLNRQGRRDEAVAMAHEALEYYEDMAEERPDAWNHRLAAALRDTAFMLRDSGKSEQARLNLARSEEIFRALCDVNNDHYAADLVETLYAQVQFADDNMFGDPVALLEEALGIVVASNRVATISARVACTLYIRLKGKSDPRANAAAVLALLHVLGVACQLDGPNRLEWFWFVPSLVMAIVPNPGSGLQTAAFRIARACGLDETGNPKDAMERLARIEPDDLMWLATECHLELTMAMKRSAGIPYNLAEAQRFVDFLQAPQGLNPDPRAQALIAQGLDEERAGGFEQSLRTYDMALSEQPQEQQAAFIWYAKGGVLCNLGRAAEAEQAYLRAARHTASPELVVHALSNLAKLLLDASRLPEAHLCMERAIRISPAMPDLWRQRAATLYYMNRYAEAWMTAEHALAHDPGDDVAQSILAEASNDARQMMLQLEQTSAKLALNANDRAAQQQHLVALLNLGEAQQVLEVGDRMLREHDGGPAIHSLLAAAWLALENWDEAAKELDLAPGGAEAQYLGAQMRALRELSDMLPPHE